MNFIGSAQKNGGVLKGMLRYVVSFCLTAGILLLTFGAEADVVLDGTLGPQGGLKGPDYQIRPEYGRQAGPNLFHSFQILDLNKTESATFTGPGSVQNVIGRVTGGAASQIDGALRSEIPGADLYLLNPWGLVFGPDASLDLSGSFHASTGDYLKMGESGNFYAASPAGENVLTLTSPPSAFGFLDGASPGTVTFSGGSREDVSKTFSVKTGKTLSVIGGDITVKGVQNAASALAAPEGQIQMVSAASGGEIIPTASGPDVSSLGALGKIQLSDGAVASVSGEGSGKIYIRAGQFVSQNSRLEADTLGAADGGGVDIQANESLSFQGSRIYSSTFGTGTGGSIHMRAGQADISGFSGIFTSSEPGASGDAGSLSIEAQNLTLSGGTILSSDSYTSGKGGEMFLSGSNSVNISNFARIFSTAQGTGPDAGDGGSIRIETKNLSVSKDSYISSDTAFGSGQGGSISISGTGGTSAESVTVSNSKILAGVYQGEGNGGSVSIKANAVTFADGARVKSESEGKGRGGNVSIQAGELLEFYGVNPAGDASRILTTATVKEGEAGDAGNISVQARQITVKDGGGIAANTLGPGQGGSIDVRTTGSIELIGGNPNGDRSEGFGSGFYASSDSIRGDAGNAGGISIETPVLALTNGAVITNSTQGGGSGGMIDVRAGELSISGKTVFDGPPVSEFFSGIYSRSEALDIPSGDAGSITITGSRAVLSDEGKISTSSAGPGDAGQITLNVSDIQMNTGASISSESQSVSTGGDAGTIQLISNSSIRLYSSGLSTSTDGQGNAGNIHITAPDVQIANASVSSATTSPFHGGNAGTITVDADNSLNIRDGGSLTTSTWGQGQAGAIELNARQIELNTGASVSSSSNQPSISGDAGTIRIKDGDGFAESVQVLNQSHISTSSVGTARGGDIRLDAGEVYIDGESSIKAAASNGDAGTIAVRAMDSPSKIITLHHQSQISAVSEGLGNAGSITLDVERLELFGGSEISSSSISTAESGDAGAIAVKAMNLPAASIRLFSGSSVNTSNAGDGKGGNIQLDVVNLRLEDLSSVRSTGNNGNAGTIAVKAKDAPSEIITLENQSVISTASQGLGDAGSITLDVNRLLLTGASEVSSASALVGVNGDAGAIAVKAMNKPAESICAADRSSINTSNAGQGKGGNIRLDVTDLSLMDESSVRSTGVDGDAGTIVVRAGDYSPSESVILKNWSGISTSSQGLGDAGSITLDVNRLELDTGSSVSSSSNADGLNGDAGAIAVKALDLPAASIRLSTGSTISTSNAGMGKGGNIRLDAVDLNLEDYGSVSSTGNDGDAGTIMVRARDNPSERLSLKNQSEISTASKGRGNAGAVTLDVNFLEMDRGSSISSSSDAADQSGNAGTIAIKAMDRPLSSMRLRNGSSVSTSSAGRGTAGDIRLNVSDLRLEGASSIQSTGRDGDAGTIAVRAKNNPSEVVLLENRSLISTASSGLGSAGSVSLDVNRLELHDQSEISSSSKAPGESGNAGSITVRAMDLPATVVRMGAGSSVTTSTQGTGNAGSVTLDVHRLELDGGSSVSSSSNASGPGGNAGAIAVRAADFPTASISILNGSSVSTSAAGQGRGGDIQLDVMDLHLASGSSIRSTGNNGDAGTIAVRAKNSPSDTVSLHNKSVISTSSEGLGNAGSISLAVKRFEADGGSSVSSSSIAPGQSGNAGAIAINADDISTASIHLANASSISTSAAGTGKGGNIQLDVTDLSLSDESSVRSTGSHGDAGTIAVRAKNSPSDTVSLQNKSVISTSSEGLGNAGSISLAVKRFEAGGGSSVSSSSIAAGQSGNAGAIAINADDISTASIRLANASSISTSAAGTGKGGNIQLDVTDLSLSDESSVRSTGNDGDAGTIAVRSQNSPSDTVNLQNKSVISTSSEGLGNAGSISLAVKRFEAGGGSSVSSSSIATGQSGNAGAIAINAEDMSAESIRIANASSISTSAAGTGKGGNIQLDVTDLSLSDESSVRSTGNDGDAGTVVVKAQNSPSDTVSLQNKSVISTSSEGLGNAGSISLAVKRFEAGGGSSVSSSSTAKGQSGNAGAITINADDRSTGSTESTSSIRLTNASSISTSAAGTGKGGNIQLGVADLSLENESSIRSTGNDGDAGTIVISGNSPSETIRLHNQSVISTSSEGLGNAGSITLAANRLDLDVESSISSSSLSTGEGGNAGRIEIAGNDLNLRGKSFIATETRGRGNAGAIAMMLNRLEMETGAFISSESKSTGRGGHAGVITIQADERIRLTGGNVFIGTTTSGEGAGGDIYLDTRLLEMNGGAFISSASLSENTAGNAGSIRIQCADSILLQEGSSITTEALNAGGGIIWIYVANQLYLKDSAISTSVRFGAGNGGDIEIFDPEFLILKNARIIANAYEGRGGNIHIVTGLLIQSAGSVVSASSELGIDGTVNIESPDANLSGALVSLPANFLDAAVWALKPCSERVGETASSLVVVERDGVSMSPEDWTPGPY